MINKTDFFQSKSNKIIDSKDMENMVKEIKLVLEKYHFKTPIENIDEIIEYLPQKEYHLSEGRDLSFDKKTYSITEIMQAYKYKNKPKIMTQYLLYRYKFNYYPRKKVSSQFPTVLCIEPTSICNLRCTMCFQSDENFSKNKEMQGNMSLEMFKKIIDEGKNYGLSSIVLASRGEPMLNKNIFEMIRYAKENGVIDIKMNTNATLMNEKKCRKLLESGLDNLVFSVDSPNKEEFERIRRGANFDKIINNIKTFNRIRSEEFPNSKLRTRISMVVLDEKQDINFAEKFWGNLVDEFAFRNVINRLYIYDKENLKTTRPCSLLWERLYIWFDGKISLCDEDYMSNLSPGIYPEDGTIHDIWTGDYLNSIREKHLNSRKNDLHPCDKCPGF